MSEPTQEEMELAFKLMGHFQGTIACALRDHRLKAETTTRESVLADVRDALDSCDGDLDFCRFLIFGSDR